MVLREKWKRCAAMWAAAAMLFVPTGGGDGPGIERKPWRGETETAAWSLFGGRAPASSRRLMPGGTAVGVSVATQGVTVIGVSALESGASPAADAGLQAGDIIFQVDGRNVETAKMLLDMVSRGGERALRVRRGDKTVDMRLVPVQGEDGQYRMGAWVQDGAAGIGTLTFYDPADGCYGALGHAICDAESGEKIAITGGDLVTAEIGGVRKSAPGAPGELLGSLGSERLGSVKENSPYGVFGNMDRAYVSSLYPEGLEILSMAEVREGKASLLSTVGSEGPQEYQCEIVAVRKQDRPDTRGLMLRVTDERLLNVTGGIVQGMSGSPILQSGKLLGAVTHVCLNDPACGYGVFIDWMLEETDVSRAA